MCRIGLSEFKKICKQLLKNILAAFFEQNAQMKCFVQKFRRQFLSKLGCTLKYSNRFGEYRFLVPHPTCLLSMTTLSQTSTAWVRWFSHKHKSIETIAISLIFHLTFWGKEQNRFLETLKMLSTCGTHSVSLLKSKMFKINFYQPALSLEKAGEIIFSRDSYSVSCHKCTAHWHLPNAWLRFFLQSCSKHHYSLPPVLKQTCSNLVK